MLHRLYKPWFVYQPMRTIRRILLPLSSPPPRGYQPIATSWGVPIIADPSRAIGRAITQRGIYDIAVSETLARLISPGDTVVDAGANVGYMTVLASVAAGPKGRVLSFEPHPELFPVLQRNADEVRRRFSIAQADLHQSALGERPGEAELLLPPGMETNDGLARIATGDAGDDKSVTVKVESLDDVLGNEAVAVMKLDVEGFEPQVLRGASRALRERRIRHIVFEDYAIEKSETVALLREAGYQVLALGWALRGPKVQPLEAGSLATHYEAPSFIGTIDPDEVIARSRPRGWRVLRKKMAAPVPVVS